VYFNFGLNVRTGIRADKGVNGIIPQKVGVKRGMKLGMAVSLVLKIPMGPRMACSNFFSANPHFRSAKVYVLFSANSGFRYMITVLVLFIAKGIFMMGLGVFGVFVFLGDFVLRASCKKRRDTFARTLAVLFLDCFLLPHLNK
jgi:hypothetical protein